LLYDAELYPFYYDLANNFFWTIMNFEGGFCFGGFLACACGLLLSVYQFWDHLLKNKFSKLHNQEEKNKLE
jgi:hypothetical protein